jgi:hypothetical protein
MGRDSETGSKQLDGAVMNQPGSGEIRIEIADPIPLTAEEKSRLVPCLSARGLNPALLDIMTNIPHRTRLVKAYSENGELLAVTSILLTPSIFMKHCFGVGNHLGSNNTFYFSETVQRREVLSAMFRALVALRPLGYYIGLIDDDAVGDFIAALDDVPHAVARKVLESGSVATRDPSTEQMIFHRHRHLKRQVNRFRNKGGVVRLLEGPVGANLADDLVACCVASYRRNIHPVQGIDIDLYGVHVREFLTTFPDMVTFYAELQDRIVGFQSFVRHERHLELVEGGFLSHACHAYENIIVTSLRYGIEHELDRVSYGLVLNRPKDRLMDRDTRKPIFFILFFRQSPGAAEIAKYREYAHLRFPTMYWKSGHGFTDRPL